MCFYPKVIWTIFDPFGNYIFGAFLSNIKHSLTRKMTFVNYNNYKEKIFPKTKNIQNICNTKIGGLIQCEHGVVF